MAWGLFPLVFAAASMSLDQIGVARRDLSGDLGHRAARDRRAVRSRRTEVADRLRACGCRRLASASWSLVVELRRLRGRRACCSASARRWSIRRCSRRSATSRTRRGARRRSACTGSGATSATPSGALLAGHHRGCARALRRRCGWSPAITFAVGCRCGAVGWTETPARDTLQFRTEGGEQLWLSHVPSISIRCRLREEIQSIYARVAADPGGAFHFHRGPAYAAELLGYDADALAALPRAMPRSRLPASRIHTARADAPGATVVDIGCGAGIDLLLAAQAVGPRAARSAWT